MQSLFSWEAPSNIAFIKYWGKKPQQIPCNPSLSMTLDFCKTATRIEVVERKENWVHFELAGKEEPSFLPKIEKLLAYINQGHSFFNDYSFNISSSNTFPHSSGIASSASSMAALALCLTELRYYYEKLEHDDETFFQDSSLLARMGSGSAARSLYGGMTIWGDDNERGNDLFAVKHEEVSDEFKELQDSILIVSKNAKPVSSTKGHQLLESNPFANARFTQANENINMIKRFLKTGDLDGFIEVLEQEALSLHAMMMTSSPSYLLMLPGTLSIIERVRDFRNKTKLPLGFTLDAGPNVHLIYPKSIKKEVIELIDQDLINYTQNGEWIDDSMGKGPINLLRAHE